VISEVVRELADGNPPAEVYGKRCIEWDYESVIVALAKEVLRIDDLREQLSKNVANWQSEVTKLNWQIESMKQEVK
jgi:prefoldin subunit 5